MTLLPFFALLASLACLGGGLLLGTVLRDDRAEDRWRVAYLDELWEKYGRQP